MQPSSPSLNTPATTGSWAANWLSPPWSRIGLQMSVKALWPAPFSTARRLGGASQAYSASTLASGITPSFWPVMIIDGFCGGVRAGVGGRQRGVVDRPRTRPCRAARPGPGR